MRWKESPWYQKVAQLNDSSYFPQIARALHCQKNAKIMKMSILHSAVSHKNGYEKFKKEFNWDPSSRMNSG